jgi:hypothetical protein
MAFSFKTKYTAQIKYIYVIDQIECGIYSYNASKKYSSPVIFLEQLDLKLKHIVPVNVSISRFYFEKRKIFHNNYNIHSARICMRHCAVVA